VHTALRRCGEPFEYSAKPTPVFRVGRGRSEKYSEKYSESEAVAGSETHFDYHISIFSADDKKTTGKGGKSPSSGAGSYHIDVRRRYADRFRFMRQYIALREAITEALGLGSRLQLALSSPTLSGRSLREKDSSFKTLLVGRQVDPKAPMTCPSVPRKFNPPAPSAKQEGSMGSMKIPSLGRDLPGGAGQAAATGEKKPTILGQIPGLRMATPKAKPHQYQRSPRSKRRSSDGEEDGPGPMQLDAWSVQRNAPSRG